MEAYAKAKSDAQDRLDFARHPLKRENVKSRKREKGENEHMTTSTKEKNTEVSATLVLTPEFRVSYPAVFQPKSAAEGQELKYSISMIFPKVKDASGKWKSVMDSAPAEMKAAVVAAIINKWGADKTKWPKGLKLPFRDGAEKDQDGYGEGVLFVNASSKNKPGVVDQGVKDIIDPSKFYGGCYARAKLNAFAYDKAGNRGVAFGLNNVQLIRDGEPFGARSNPSNDFDSIPTPSGTPAGIAANDALTDLGL
jgi:hypothetical protein